MSQVFIYAQKDGLVQEGTYIQNILAKEYASHVAYCKTPSIGTTLCECLTEPRLWMQQSF